MTNHGDYSPEAREAAHAQGRAAAGVFADHAEAIVAALPDLPDGHVLVAVVDDDHAFAGTHHVPQDEIVARVPELEGAGWAMVFTAGTDVDERPPAHRRDGHAGPPPRRDDHPDPTRAMRSALSAHSRLPPVRWTAPAASSLISQMTAPAVTTAPTSAFRPVTVPALWALIGCSIFIASSTTIG